MITEEMLQYEKELEEHQKRIRELVLTGLEGVQAVNGRECREFFDELEKKYRNA